MSRGRCAAPLTCSMPIPNLPRSAAAAPSSHSQRSGGAHRGDRLIHRVAVEAISSRIEPTRVTDLDGEHQTVEDPAAPAAQADQADHADATEPENGD